MEEVKRNVLLCLNILYRFTIFIIIAYIAVNIVIGIVTVIGAIFVLYFILMIVSVAVLLS